MFCTCDDFCGTHVCVKKKKKKVMYWLKKLKELS